MNDPFVIYLGTERIRRMQKELARKRRRAKIAERALLTFCLAFWACVAYVAVHIYRRYT